MLPYKIIQGSCGPDLEARVRAEIDNGYSPVGGLTMQSGYYLQAMILTYRTPLAPITDPIASTAIKPPSLPPGAITQQRTGQYNKRR
jgi:hypothetical protein